MALIRLNNQSLTAVTSAGLPSGTVLQVVSATGNGETVANVADTWTVTDASIVITPTSSLSKIFITHMAGGLGQYTQDIGFRLKRNTTVVYSSNRLGYVHTSLNWGSMNYPLIYLDSPATTSAITYTTEIKLVNAGELRHCDNATWSMVAMEIAG